MFRPQFRQLDLVIIPIVFGARFQQIRVDIKLFLMYSCTFDLACITIAVAVTVAIAVAVPFAVAILFTVFGVVVVDVATIM
jgi:hypothetical protein